MKTASQTHSISISDKEAAILKTIDDQQGSMVKTLLAWSSQNSGSHNRDGLIAMRALLMDAAKVLPGRCTELPLAPGEYVTAAGVKEVVHYEPAVHISVRPDAPIKLVLTGHYDTVFPRNFHFQNPTYLDDDTVNGPGVADMKGGILVMLHALQALEQSPQADNIGYDILLSPDEEIGSPGSAPELMRLGKAAHVGLTFEPALADGSMAGARKGSGNFALIIKGRAAHAGREHHLGRNAIAAMARFITRLDDLNGTRPDVTFNIAKVDGGGASNIVPELAIGRFNVRVKNDGDDAWVIEQITKLTAQINAMDGITAEMTGGFTRPPKPMSPANAQVFDWVKQAGDLLGQNIRWAPSGGVCEGNNLWAAGCPNVDTLGVRGGEIHSDREFVKLSSLTERTKLAALIMMKLASGEFDAHSVKALATQNLKDAAKGHG
ncbi:hydrolase [Fretibacter rubidus]|uniref:hydrolase n=1 Tax=Fretibacter rubidus TaxID=570162 RepID=UPI00352AAFF0